MKKISQMEPWIGDEETKAMDAYMRSGGWLTEFKKTQEFEEMLAKFTGSRYASAVNNGTVSLFIALSALGIGGGDEVLVPDLTMIASANTVILAGAIPILVDIDPKTLCTDLSKAKKAITSKTKALMYVSFNGRSGNMEEVLEFCNNNNLYLIEDSAQSLGSYYKGKHLGTFGQVGSFSFSTPKIITTGQGGALVTNSPDLIDKIRKIKDFGRVKSGIDEHVVLGYNFKFTDMQAVIGIEQMKKLKPRIKRKKEMYGLYKKELLGVNKISFIETNLEDTSPWFIDILVDDREDLARFLSENSIGTRPFYPPVHTQAPYNNWKQYGSFDFVQSSSLSKKGLWLPSSTFLTDSDIIYVCSQVKAFYAKKNK